MKKSLKILSGLLAVTLLVSGCQVGKKKVYSPKDPVSITIWTYYNGDQLMAFNGLVEEFNDTVGKEEGIYVESFSQGTVNDLETTVMAAAQGKVGADEVPNIFAAYSDTAYTVDQMGLLVDLDEYLTDKERERYVDSYLDEGRFSDEGGIKIFPTAKSTEILMVNRTDWEIFAQETGASYEDLKTMEGLVEVSRKYYQWTDSLTDEPDDGKAFFGRDAVANYFLIGSMQLGTELFQVQDGKMTLNFEKETIRKLWDNFYVPFVKGYFAADGRFRSDDVKTGNILAFVGSTSGATFFPNQVIVSDTESYPIQMEVLPCPRFDGGEKYAVQQGAGMVVTKGTEAEIQASVEFLKWFTQPERNILFSIGSGYLPVTKEANSMEEIRKAKDTIDPIVENILEEAVATVNENQLYTPRAFPKGSDARSILEYSMSDKAMADREIVEGRIADGETMEEAAAEFLTDECFDAWYEETLSRLQECEG
ncbi:MAG: extracellular solute-binding protein [Eubacteriales bacterium]|nr:extracellular solute-binding protein [Eubacteriales bacterium]